MDDNQRLQRQVMELHRRLHTRTRLSLQRPVLYSAQTCEPSRLQQHTEQDKLLFRPQSFPPRVHASGQALPEEDNDNWPLPPTPVSHDNYQPPTSQDLVGELTSWMRGTGMDPQEQPFYQPQPHYPGFRVQTPEYCAPYSRSLPSQHH